MRQRRSNTAHSSRPWRIHELTRDFRLEDVWALPAPGGTEDFPRLVQLIASGNPQDSSHASRGLWAIRWKLGELLGWDGPDAGPSSRVPTLGDRLPADLREGPSGPDFDALPFTSLYLTDHEWAAEIANRTMHGVLHLGWVPDGAGSYHGQMAVLVKPNGLLGSAYMAAIRPFRHLIVYPAMMRQLEREWRRRGGDPTPAHAGTAGRVRQVAVPPAARALSTLSRVDYEDTFLVETDASQERTAEQWARATLEEAPASVRRNLRWGWFALGLKLDSARHERSVLGWELRRSTPDFALLAARSRVGLPAELLFQRQEDTLLVATFVRQQNPVARAMWAAVAPGHRQVVPSLLARGARSERRRCAGPTAVR